MMLAGVGESVTAMVPLPPVYQTDGPTGILTPAPVGSDSVNVYHPINTGSDLGSQVAIVQTAAQNNPFSGLSAATGLSTATLLLISGGLILFFATKK